MDRQPLALRNLNRVYLKTYASHIFRLAFYFLHSGNAFFPDIVRNDH
jgi:hypothetical protein